jgi:hypothetical protein
MASLRSQETIQKEYDLQADYTTRINVTLQDAHPSYREMLEDYAVFANEVRKVAPEKTMVLLHPRPEVIMVAEGDNVTAALHMCDNMWRFKVDNSVHYCSQEKALAATFLLKRMWDAAISCLPENFIIQGRVDPNDPDKETESRTRLQQTLRFCEPQVNNAVYTIKRNGQLEPITLEEVLSLIGTDIDSLHQKFNVRKIDWKGV